MVVISYHLSGAFTNTYATARGSFYGISSTPDVRIDGTTDIVGGIHTGTMYPAYRAIFDTRKSSASPITIDMGVTYDSAAREGHLSVVLHNPGASPVTGQLQIALLERGIAYSWQGLDSVYTAERTMLPNATGEAITVTAGDSLVKERDFTVDAAWNAHKCDLVAFVQDNSSKVMLQAAREAVAPAPEIAYLAYEPVLPLPNSEAALLVHLDNVGTGAAGGVTATLTTSDSFVGVVTGSATYGAIPRNSEHGPDAGFRIRVLGTCPDPHLAWFDLSISADGYSSVASFPVNITAAPGFDDAMESGENGWSHSGILDNWHQTTHRSHTESHSWYSGTEGSWEYSNENDARLVTPFFTLGDNNHVAFWHRYATEPDFDYCLVEVNNGSGFWQLLGSFTGQGSDWQFADYALAGLSNQTARVRFRFLSDANVTAEGWYIDDLAAGRATGAAEHARPVTRAAALALDRNPVSKQAEVSYSVPAGRAGSLDLFDVNGRRIAGLAEGLHGQGRVNWEVPAAVQSGMYFVRLQAGSENPVMKVSILK